MYCTKITMLPENRPHLSETKHAEVLFTRNKAAENHPHLSVTKHGYTSKSNLVKAFQCMLYRVENIFAVAHNEEKVKTTSLCYLCSYVRMGVFMPKHDKTPHHVRSSGQRFDVS